MTFAPQYSRSNSIASLSEKLDLNFSLRNVPKMDLLSPSDPFIIVHLLDEQHHRWMKKGVTEIVWDNPNPDFSKDVRIEYLFEQVQKVRLDIYDANEQQTHNLSKHDFIGNAEFIIGDLVTSDGQKLVLPITAKTGKKLGKQKGLQPIVIIRSLEVDENYDEVEIQFSAKELPKMDWFGKVDPFFQIYRQTNDGSWASAYTSEHCVKTYRPNWKRFTVEVRRLCHSDYNRPILIRCWDWNRDQAADYVGELETSLANLLDSQCIPWQYRDKKTKKIKKKKRGFLLIKLCNVIKKYSFTSFLGGGLEIQLMIAIDFTGSNGHPSDSKSLHYMGPPKNQSQYMQVINSVGRVLEPYDNDGEIAAWGFGANLNPRGKQVSHCFNITLKPTEEEVHGIDGVVTAYRQCLQRVQLYGPTYFGEILRNAAAKSMGICDQQKQQYNILLIITDGVINDMKNSCDAIVDATLLPLSVIIVGVGDADFSNMDTLDADDVPLRHSKTGRLMQRDIVQFVPFNEFKNKHSSILAKETLEEVPGQVQSFMQHAKIHPNPAIHAKQASQDIYAALNNANNDDYKQPPVVPYVNNNYNALPNKQGSEGQITQPGGYGNPNANNYNSQNNNQNNLAPQNPYY